MTTTTTQSDSQGPVDTPRGSFDYQSADSSRSFLPQSSGGGHATYDPAQTDRKPPYSESNGAAAATGFGAVAVAVANLVQLLLLL